MNAFGKAKLAQITANKEMDWASTYEELLPKVYHYFCLRIGDRLEAEEDLIRMAESMKASPAPYESAIP